MHGGGGPLDLSSHISASKNDRGVRGCFGFVIIHDYAGRDELALWTLRILNDHIFSSFHLIEREMPSVLPEFGPSQYRHNQ